MKALILGLFLLTGLTLLPSTALAADQRIGTIDLRKVFDDYWKTKEADAALKDQVEDLKKEETTMTEQYNKSKEEYKTSLERANEQAISSEERERRKKAAEGKLTEVTELEQAIVQFGRQARTTLEDKQRIMREKLLDEIRAVIESKAKAGAYTLVIDVAAESRNITPVILFSTGESDLTEAVLAQLNESARPALKPAADAKPKSK